MKLILIAVFLCASLSGFASMDASEVPSKVTSTEIAKNRSCFQELEVQGCRNPDEDPSHFRSCLSNSLSSLTAECQKMMKELYEVK